MPSRQHAATLPVSLPIALAVAALAAAFAAPAAYAQYKWIDADGRVNYGDRPPPSDSRRVMRGPAGVHSSEAPAAGDHRLPYALRSATSRYPVVLYTAPDCAPCDLGRNHLAQRGVPYTEKLVQTAADVRAFNALQLGSTQFPVFTVGTDRVHRGHRPDGRLRSHDVEPDARRRRVSALVDAAAELRRPHARADERSGAKRQRR